MKDNTRKDDYHPDDLPQKRDPDQHPENIPEEETPSRNPNPEVEP